MSETTKYCHRCEDEVKLKKDPTSNAMKCCVCGTILVHSANHLPQGTIVNGFEIINEIGRGGMGIVYNANQLNLQRSVALKVLSDDLANDDEFVERFFKEARAAASLNHPNIVQVFDAGSTLDGIYYFAMELVTGETIEDRIEREGAFPPKEALKIAVKISDAMDYVWKSQKLTHGDIKPENIILNEKGEAKLADLGLAKFIHEKVSTDGVMVTPLYAPPEIIRGDNHKISFKSDMYSFGATLYQMFAGKPPFPDGPPDEVFLCHLNDTPPSLSTQNERLAAPLVRIVNDLLDKNPDKRSESWEILCKSLKRIKDPEGSGKVFHTRSHLHDSRDEVLPTGDSIAENAESGEAASESIGSMSLMIKVLLSLVLVLFVAIAVVVSFPKKTIKISKTDPAVPTAIAELSPVEEWNELKRRMNAMKKENALVLLKAFTAKHGSKCPPAAIRHLKKMQNAAKAGDRRRVEIARFAKNIQKTEKAARNFLRTKNRATVAQLQSYNKNIGALLNQASRKKYLKISNAQRRSLTNSLTSIRNELKRRSNQFGKQAKERARRELLKKKAQLKQAIAIRIKKKLASELSMAATTDDYYSILASYQRKNKISVLEKDLSKWKSESKIRSASYSSRVDFLLNTIIPNSRLVLEILMKREKDLVSHRLPRRVCSEKLSTYTVRAINETGIKLERKKGKVFLGHTLKWSKISAQRMVALLKGAVLDNKSTPPNPQEERTVLAYAVLKAPDVAGYLLTSLRTLKHDEIQKWKEIIRDMNKAVPENDLTTLYSTLKRDMKAGKTLEASDKFINLTLTAKDSIFAERYSNELARLRPIFAKTNPKITAIDWITKALVAKSNPQASDLKKSLNTLMSIDARYGNVMPQLDRTIVKDFSTRRDEVVSTIVIESGVTDMKEKRVPFYYWIKERQGDAWAFFKLTERRPRIKTMPKLLSSMKLAASLDNGDWRTAKSIFLDGKTMSSDELAGMKRLRSWAPSFLFGKGVVALQYGHLAEVLRSRDILKSMAATSASQNSAIAPLATSLAMEFSIMSRDYSAAIRMGDEFTYNDEGNRWRTEGRVALLAILARCSANKQAKVGIQEFTQKFGETRRLAGDITWLRSASHLISGHPLSPPQIRELATANCYFSDTTARIMSSTLAQYYVEKRRNFKDEDRLIATIETRITSSLVSGDLWRRTLLLRLARGATPQKFTRQASERLSDLRISSMRAYPFLLELKTGAEVACGRVSTESAKEILSNYLKASLLTGSADFDNLNVITSDDPTPMIKRLFTENRPLTAIRAALLALATHKQPKMKLAISTILKENAAVLQWEELNTVRVMERWR